MPNDVRTTVLVVDDDPDFVADFALALDASGFRVLEASDAKSAYEVMESGKRIDVVVVDLVLPDKSGLEVVHETRRQNPRVKLVATTEIHGPLHLEIAGYMGANVAIRKFARSPFGQFPASEWVSQIRNVSASS